MFNKHATRSGGLGNGTWGMRSEDYGLKFEREFRNLGLQITKEWGVGSFKA